MKRDGEEWMGQKMAILAWRNYWTAPNKYSSRVFEFSNWFTHTIKCIWYLTSYHLPVQTHPNNFIPTFCNFFGKCEKIQREIHSIVITLLQWDWARSVGGIFVLWITLIDLNILERAYSLIINNNTKSWNIVAGWSKHYFDFICF